MRTVLGYINLQNKPMNNLSIERIITRLMLVGSICYGISSYLLFLRDSEQVKHFSSISNLSFLNTLSAWSLHAIKVNHSSWLLFAISLFVLWIAYYLLLKHKPVFSKKYIILIYALFILSFPSLSTDVFDYINLNRIAWVYGQNPYMFTMSEYPNDTFSPLGRWQSKTPRYGPAHFLVTAPLQFIARDNILAYLLLFKMLQIVCVIAIAWAISKLAQGNSYKSVFWLLNPIVLIEVVGNLHNDIVMMAFFCIGLVFLRKEFNGRGIMFVILSVLTKFMTILYLPSLLVSAVGNPKQRQLYIKQAVLIGLSMCIVSGAINLILPKLWEVFLEQNTLYWGSTPGALFHSLNKIGVSAILIELSKAIFFLGSVLTSIWLFRRKADRAPVEWYVIFMLVYLIFISSLVWPWYILWVLPMLFIQSNNVLKSFSLIFGFSLSFQYVLLNLSYYMYPLWWGWQVIFWLLIPLSALLFLNKVWIDKIIAQIMIRLFHITI